MEQNRSRRAAARCFFVLVGPTPVVSERLGAKQTWLGGSCGRIVHQHHEDLAAIISRAFVVVPTLLRRLDTVTHEDEICIDVNVLSLCACEGDEVVGKLKTFITTRAGDG